MTDIPERLRYMADAGVPIISTKLMREAADEIERLRGMYEETTVALQKLCDNYGCLGGANRVDWVRDEIERLRAALEHIAKETEPDDLTLEYVPTSTAEFARAALNIQQQPTGKPR